jgi:hypothetical protein
VKVAFRKAELLSTQTGGQMENEMVISQDDSTKGICYWRIRPAQAGRADPTSPINTWSRRSMASRAESCGARVEVLVAAGLVKKLAAQINVIIHASVS